MILSALIFFSEDFHKKCIDRFHRTLNVIHPKKSPNTINAIQKEKRQRLVRPISIVLSLVIVFQILFPFRHLLYPGELFWHEQGYRFSWRGMLLGKKGYIHF